MHIDTATSNICFDDVLLVPKKSSVASRSSVNIKTILGNPNNPEAHINLDMPFLLAPMDFISTNEMIYKIIKRGGMGFINRWQNVVSRLTQLKDLSKLLSPNNKLGFSLNIEEANNIDFVNKILSHNVNTLLIDTAFGHTDVCINAVKKLRSSIPNNIHIMAGNVSSYEAYNDLMNSGADSVRVGIGGGAACNTRFATGFGVPVLSSVMDVYNNVNTDQVNGLISDGAIKQTGDIVKALAAGASAVMMGSMFSGHEECEKNEFRGTASLSLQLDLIDKKPENASSLHVEGVHGKVEKRGSVEDTINQMVNNLTSGMSYCGSENLKDFRENCKFIVVSSQSIQESAPRV